MRVILNEWSAGGVRTGIGHYTAQLAAHLRPLPGLDELISFPGPFVQRVVGRLKGLANSGHQSATAAGPAAPPGFKARLRERLRQWWRAGLAWHFRRRSGRAELYHEPNYLPLPSDLPTVATLHDLSALRHPEWHPRDRVAHFERHLPRALTQACHFCAISEFGRQEIVRHLGVAAERVTVTYMGSRAHLRPLPAVETAAVLQKLGLPPQYLLHVGTVEPRKNLDLLVRAYTGLPAALREHWPLLLVGGWGWGAGGVADYLRGAGRRDGVLHLGYVDEAHLAALYNGARALAFPTLYEGFGMPAVEMLACGGAVLASTAAAVAEVVGTNAHLTDPHDEAGWRDAIRRVLTDDDWWRQLRAGAVERARPFTWRRCAEDTLRAYGQALGRVPERAPISRAA
jgi:alpha-1,3-rhamnosyl/mannosyltransferase